jgi:hypothetical protein
MKKHKKEQAQREKEAARRNAAVDSCDSDDDEVSVFVNVL